MHFLFYYYEKCKISCVIGKYCYFVNRYGDWNAAMFSMGCETQRPSYPILLKYNKCTKQNTQYI